MPLKVNKDGTWVTVTNIYANVNGTWKDCCPCWVKENDTWVIFHTCPPTPTPTPTPTATPTPSPTPTPTATSTPTPTPTPTQLCYSWDFYLSDDTGQLVTSSSIGLCTGANLDLNESGIPGAFFATYCIPDGINPNNYLNFGYAIQGAICS
jgi:hypothetical protein